MRSESQKPNYLESGEMDMLFWQKPFEIQTKMSGFWFSNGWNVANALAGPFAIRSSKICILNVLGFFMGIFQIPTVVQWGSKIRPFENRNHLKTRHFEGWFSNVVTFQKPNKILFHNFVLPFENWTYQVFRSPLSFTVIQTVR